MKLVESFFDILYPQLCLICGRPTGDEVCKKCVFMLRKQEILRIDEYNLNEDKYFNEHMYFYIYDGLIRNLFLQYKFNQKSYLYKIFLKSFKNNKKIYLFLKKYDIIIPVPISKKRKKQRGYNQSALIAKDVSECFGIQYCDDSLIKVKDIIPQSLLKKEERTKNVENVYTLRKQDKIKNKNVLLIDDIYTTGSTVNECSKILKQAGAANIGILTIAKD